MNKQVLRVQLLNKQLVQLRLVLPYIVKHLIVVIWADLTNWFCLVCRGEKVEEEQGVRN